MTYIRDSPKRLHEFTNILSEVLPSSETSLGYEIPIPGQFCREISCLFAVVRRTTTRLLSIGRDPCEVHVISARAGKVETFFMMRAMRLLFGIADPVHKAVQGLNEKIGDVKRRVNLLKETLQIVRDGHCQTGDAAKLFYQVTKQKEAELQIDIPALPRSKAIRYHFTVVKAGEKL